MYCGITGRQCSALREYLSTYNYMALTPVMSIRRLTQTNKLTYLSDSSSTHSSDNTDTSDDGNIEPSAIKSDILYQKTLAGYIFNCTNDVK